MLVNLNLGKISAGDLEPADSPVGILYGKYSTWYPKYYKICIMAIFKPIAVQNLIISHTVALMYCIQLSWGSCTGDSSQWAMALKDTHQDLFSVLTRELLRYVTYVPEGGSKASYRYYFLLLKRELRLSVSLVEKLILTFLGRENIIYNIGKLVKSHTKAVVSSHTNSTDAFFISHPCSFSYLVVSCKLDQVLCSAFPAIHTVLSMK